MGSLLEKIVEGKTFLAKLVCFWLNVSVLLLAVVSRKALQGSRETWRCAGLPRKQARFRGSFEECLPSQGCRCVVLGNKTSWVFHPMDGHLWGCAHQQP